MRRKNKKGSLGDDYWHWGYSIRPDSYGRQLLNVVCTLPMCLALLSTLPTASSSIPITPYWSISSFDKSVSFPTTRPASWLEPSRSIVQPNWSPNSRAGYVENARMGDGWSRISLDTRSILIFPCQRGPVIYTVRSCDFTFEGTRLSLSYWPICLLKIHWKEPTRPSSRSFIQSIGTSSWYGNDI